MQKEFVILERAGKIRVKTGAEPVHNPPPPGWVPHIWISDARGVRSVPQSAGIATESKPEASTQNT